MTPAAHAEVILFESKGRDMPVSPTYPGVYIDEISRGVHTITGVPTSIAAFVGSTSRGPTDGPVHITSLADFQRTFGEVSYANPSAWRSTSST